MAKIGVCLSGCGVQDGSEIHEAVLTLLALDRSNTQIVCLSPDMEQHHVANHASGKDSKEKRNVLVEAARIARGNIKNIKEIKASDIDALIFPGGYGAALNLCNFAVAGEKCTVQPEVKRLIEAMHAEGKPLGAICIAPAILACVLGGKHVRLTIGNDHGTASKLEAMGAKHVECKVNDIVVDDANKVVTTPAYMLANRISEAAEGIEKLVKKIVTMVSTR
jgi:enhancing lycopene biosynthesis protein 2